MQGGLREGSLPFLCAGLWMEGVLSLDGTCLTGAFAQRPKVEGNLGGARLLAN